MSILIKINKEVFKHTVCIKGNFYITISNTPVRDIRKKLFCPNGLEYKSSNAIRSHEGQKTEGRCSEQPEK